MQQQQQHALEKRDFGHARARAVARTRRGVHASERAWSVCSRPKHAALLHIMCTVFRPFLCAAAAARTHARSSARVRSTPRFIWSRCACIRFTQRLLSATHASRGSSLLSNVGGGGDTAQLLNTPHAIGGCMRARARSRNFRAHADRSPGTDYARTVLMMTMETVNTINPRGPLSDRMCLRETAAGVEVVGIGQPAFVCVCLQTRWYAKHNPIR